MNNIDSAARQIHSLVKCILDLSEMEQGALPLSKTTLNAVETIENLRQQFSKDITEKSGQLLFYAPETSILCHADKSLLIRIIQNLLSNAIKYGMSNSKPNIILSVEKTEDKVKFCVQDNGPGIPEEYQELIFKKFYQINHSDKGLGLGLTFCKMAADSMGGALTMENLPNGGSSFCLTLTAAK